MSNDRIKARRLVSDIARNAAMTIAALSEMVETTQDINEPSGPGIAATGGSVHGPSVGPHLEAVAREMADVTQHVQTLAGLVTSLRSYQSLT
jgi:hypothetical protein